MNADKETLGNTVGSQARVFVSRDELVELVNFVVLQPGNPREVGRKVLVNLGSLLKGQQSKLSPFLVDVLGQPLGFVPFVGVRSEVGVDLLAQDLGETEVGLVVVRVVPVLYIGEISETKQKRNTRS